MSNATEGPWVIRPGTPQPLYGIYHPTGKTAAGFSGPVAKEENVGTAWGEANARLMAAAPELLAALRLAEATLTTAHRNVGETEDSAYRETLIEVRLAILKATVG